MNGGQIGKDRFGGTQGRDWKEGVTIGREQQRMDGSQKTKRIRRKKFK
jgi:hypothetical protein